MLTVTKRKTAKLAVEVMQIDLARPQAGFPPASLDGAFSNFGGLQDRPSSRPAMLIWFSPSSVPDAADHAGHVAVVQHQDVALGDGLHPEVADAGEPHGVAAEDRALHPRRARRPASPRR